MGWSYCAEYKHRKSRQVEAISSKKGFISIAQVYVCVLLIRNKMSPVI